MESLSISLNTGQADPAPRIINVAIQHEQFKLGLYGLYEYLGSKKIPVIKLSYNFNIRLAEFSHAYGFSICVVTNYNIP